MQDEDDEFEYHRLVDVMVDEIDVQVLIDEMLLLHEADDEHEDEIVNEDVERMG